MQLSQPLRERQPQSQARIAVLVRSLRTPEAVKYEWQHIARDPGAGIGDQDLALAAGVSHRHLGAPAAGRELDGIAEKMPHHLLQPVRVAEDEARRRGEMLLERHALALGGGLQDVEHRFHDLADVRLFGIDTNLAARDRAEVEQVIHDMGQQPGVARNRLAPGLSLLRSQPPELHEARPAEDRIEGCPQLVAQGFQELILEPSVALSLDARSVLTLEHYAQLLRGLIHRANDTKPGAWPDTLRGTEKPH